MPTCRWTGTCSRRSCKKSSTASTSARARTVGPNRLRREHATDGGADEDQSIDDELPEPTGSPPPALRMRLHALAASRVRFGYRRLTVMLRREGWKVNTKRILSAVYRGRLGSTNQGAQEDRATHACSSTLSSATEPKVEHGLRRRETTRWPPVPSADRDRSVHAGVRVAIGRQLGYRSQGGARCRRRYSSAERQRRSQSITEQSS